ncbi:MAG: hypothetical protein LC737_06935, partial [Chloroflexi bacterium]|nr:hypothetical protein [Chloroflexota bacterium]
MAELLRRCFAFFVQRDVEAYLVGGTVRDQLRGRESHDLDFVVPNHALPLARELADQLGGAFYPLDSERDTGRIVLHDRTVVDVAAMRGATIEQDLSLRDFTINAMARPVTDLNELIDPFHGTDDLRASIMRVVSDQSFVLDPVRMLRAIRQSVELGLAIEAETVNLMQRDRMLLVQVTGERLRDELVKMLKTWMGPNYLEVLDEFDFLMLILPHAQWDEDAKCATDQLAVLKDKLYGGHFTDAELEFIVGKRYLQWLGDYVGELLTDARTRLLMFPLVVLYADEASADADLRRLKFSRHEIEFARALVHHGDAFARLPLTVAPLDAHRFFRDTSGVGLGLIYIALSRVIARVEQMQTLQRASSLLDYYTQQYDAVIAPKPLLDGSEIANQFNLRGRQIGQALRDLAEAQVRGDVRTREQAETYLQA